MTDTYAPTPSSHSPQYNSSPYEAESSYNPVQEEQSLWRSVIVQALMDAASMSKKPEMQQHKRDALIWLRGNSADFLTVCHHAGFDPECTKQLIQHALSKGCNWRATPGKGKRANERKPSHRKPTNRR